VFVVYGVIALLVLSFLVMFVYVRKPKYGIALGTITCVLIAVASFLYLTEDRRVVKSQQKVTPQQLRLENISMLPAYGNNYKINAKLTNLSDNYQVTSIVLKLSLKDCSSNPCIDDDSQENSVKVWLKPKNSKAFETYIKFEKLARERTPEEWTLEIISAKAK